MVREPESTNEYTCSNYCDAQPVSTGTSVVSVSATGIPVSETAYGSFLNGTQIAYGAVIEKTTGTSFQRELIDKNIVKYIYSNNSSIESLLSFLDIVNNKDGWSFLRQRYVNSIVNN